MIFLLSYAKLRLAFENDIRTSDMRRCQTMIVYDRSLFGTVVVSSKIKDLEKFFASFSKSPIKIAANSHFTSLAFFAHILRSTLNTLNCYFLLTCMLVAK